MRHYDRICGGLEGIVQEMLSAIPTERVRQHDLRRRDGAAVVLRDGRC